jgi:hypothetical protein
VSEKGRLDFSIGGRSALTSLVEDLDSKQKKDVLFAA